MEQRLDVDLTLPPSSSTCGQSARGSPPAEGWYGPEPTTTHSKPGGTQGQTGGIRLLSPPIGALGLDDLSNPNHSSRPLSQRRGGKRRGHTDGNGEGKTENLGSPGWAAERATDALPAFVLRSLLIRVCKTTLSLTPPTTELMLSTNNHVPNAHGKKGHPGSRPTLDFSSGRDLTACEFESRVGLHAIGAEPAWESLSPPLPHPSNQ